MHVESQTVLPSAPFRVECDADGLNVMSPSLRVVHRYRGSLLTAIFGSVSSDSVYTVDVSGWGVQVHPIYLHSLYTEHTTDHSLPCRCTVQGPYCIDILVCGSDIRY